MENIKIYRATSADIETCARIQTESWVTAFQGILPAEELESKLEYDRSVTGFAYSLQTPDCCTALLSLNGVPHCVATWGKSSEENADGTAELICIHSLPANWGRGYGSQMMAYILREMRTAGYQRAVLWTFAANTRARRFYEKCGWTLTGKTQQELGTESVQYGINLKE